MPRKPRWDAPGALHHVWFRGVERRPIFLDAADREYFVRRLGELVPACGAACFAWALLDNHAHAVVRSGGVPIFRLMQRLNTGHAVRFNRRRERTGHLFQGRYGSRLVSDDADLHGLVRYVHRNPLRAGLVADLRALERYPWCGYGALVGNRPPLPFEAVGDVLATFADDPRVARRRLRAWMARADEEDGAGDASAPPPLAASEPAPGAPRGFEAGAAPAALEPLIAAVCAWYGVAADELQRGAKTDRASRARAVICHLAVARGRVANKDVAAALGVSSAAVSKALPRGARLAAEECDLRRFPVGGTG